MSWRFWLGVVIGAVVMIWAGILCYVVIGLMYGTYYFLKEESNEEMFEEFAKVGIRNRAVIEIALYIEDVIFWPGRMIERGL